MKPLRHAAPVLGAALALVACASQPTADRAVLPDRPEAQRPDGQTPQGLIELRETMADRRAVLDGGGRLGIDPA